MGCSRVTQHQLLNCGNSVSLLFSVFVLPVFVFVFPVFVFSCVVPRVRVLLRCVCLTVFVLRFLLSLKPKKKEKKKKK